MAKDKKSEKEQATEALKRLREEAIKSGNKQAQETAEKGLRIFGIRIF